jgi:ABC-type Fe3+/spermidine/putrescine transport system ATPase subunit
MNGGVIQQIGTPSEVFENPSTHFVADFMGFQNFFDAEVKSVGPDGLRLENNAGQFLACDTTGAVVGDDVHIGLRAERMSIAPAASNAAAGPNSLRGTLIGSSYRGDFNVYSVETALGTFTVRAGAREDALSVGQMVVLGWTPSSLKILKRQ